jgi:AraC family transcriptional regulator
MLDPIGTSSRSISYLDAHMPMPAICSSVDVFPTWKAMRVYLYRLPAGQVTLPAISDVRLSVQFSARSVSAERHLGSSISLVQLNLDSLTFCPAGHPVYWKWDGFMELLQMQISKTFLLELATQHGLDSEKLLALDKINLHDPMITQIAHELSNLILMKEKKANPVYLDSLTSFLILHIAQKHCLDTETELLTEFQPKPRAFDFSRVINYIRDNLEKDLRLEQLARIAKLSNFYFIKQFRATFGTSPHQYILGCRIALAKQLLTETFLSMSHISQRCGFSSQSHFTSVFRQATGIPPRLFRFNNRQNKLKCDLI